MTTTRLDILMKKVEDMQTAMGIKPQGKGRHLPCKTSG